MLLLDPPRSGGAWVPRGSLVSAVVTAACLPWAHHLGSSGPFLVGTCIVLLGITGFAWSMAMRLLDMAVANLVVGVFAVPAVVALVSLVGGL